MAVETVWLNTSLFLDMMPCHEVLEASKILFSFKKSDKD
jgi:hypothetical protein